MSLEDMTRAGAHGCAGPYPGEESCQCQPVGTFGCVPAQDPRYLGGHVDDNGRRHAPLRHRNDCPILAYELQSRANLTRNVKIAYIKGGT